MIKRGRLKLYHRELVHIIHWLAYHILT